jgi:hypothetical protein
VAVLCISAVARERYKLLADIVSAARLQYDEDDNGCPVHRRILDPDAIVGAGKESGEIEYSADSVSVVARIGETWTGNGCDVVFATAKGRATGPTWSPLHFTGFRYEECPDRGGRLVQAWKDAAGRRTAEREQRKAAKEQRKGDKLDADARLIVQYVLANPGCNVGDARTNVVNANARRWQPAVERLGKALVQTPEGKKVLLSVDASTLKPEHKP